MQEEEKELEMACRFPCEVLAMTIELEHRADGMDYEKCIEIAMRVLSDKVEAHKVMPNEMLKSEIRVMQENLMNGSPLVRAMFGGDRNEM